jgi:peptidoglycan/xylan/chitin deacetylase (PgdA/CDA1 family)
MLIAVNYHYVRPCFEDPYPGIHGVTPREFKGQLETLSGLGEFVTPEAVRAAVAGRCALPSRAILITFDDGLREQFDHAWPVLCGMGIPALFFVNTAPIRDRTVSAVHKLHLCRATLHPDEFTRLLISKAHGLPVEQYLAAATPEAVAQYRYDSPDVAQLKYALNFLLPRADREALIEACYSELFPGQEAARSEALYMEIPQIRTLARAGCIGTHGHEHLPLGLLSPDKAEEALAESLSSLTEWTGAPPYALSYPYGSRDACAEWVADIANQLGIEFAFTMERAANHDLTAPLLLARYSASDLPGSAAADASLDPFHTAEARRWHRAAAAVAAH